MSAYSDQPCPAHASADGITIRALHHAFADHSVFSNFSITFTGGQWHCLLGRSGVGKSALLRIIAGLDQPRTGTVKLTGSNRSPAPFVAHMAQDDGLLPWLKVIDNVQLGARLRGERSNTTRSRALDLLSQVGLASWVHALPHQLSGGMRQRVALARTLFEQRPIVLMDEPFSRLDTLTRHELHSLAFEKLAGRTVLLVTHDPYEALQLSHQVHVLSQAQAKAVSWPVDGEPLRSIESVTPALPALWRQLDQGSPVSTQHTAST